MNKATGVRRQSAEKSAKYKDAGFGVQKHAVKTRQGAVIAPNCLDLV